MRVVEQGPSFPVRSGRSKSGLSCTVETTDWARGCQGRGAPSGDEVLLLETRCSFWRQGAPSGDKVLLLEHLRPWMPRTRCSLRAARRRGGPRSRADPTGPTSTPAQVSLSLRHNRSLLLLLPFLGLRAPLRVLDQAARPSSRPGPPAHQPRAARIGRHWLWRADVKATRGWVAGLHASEVRGFLRSLLLPAARSSLGRGEEGGEKG